jgi:hypothetical protein
MRELIASLDSIAGDLEDKGLVRSAYLIDQYTNTLEKTASEADMKTQVGELFYTVQAVYKDIEQAVKNLKDMPQEDYDKLNMQFKKIFLKVLNPLFIKVKKTYTEGGQQTRGIWNEIKQLKRSM